jgi:integrase
LSTTKSERAGLRRYFAWTVREDLRSDNPTDGIGAPRRQPDRDVRALTADEARRLLSAIPTETVAGLRLHTLATWFLITGRRHAEVLRLRWDDIDLEGGTYTYEGKGGKSERRELVPQLVKATERWAQVTAPGRRREALVFPGRWDDAPVSAPLIRKQLQVVAEQAGLGELRRPIHTRRHTNARLRREVGASTEEVQAAPDHSSLATTALYLRKLEGSADVHGAAIGGLLVGQGAGSI